MFEHRQLTEDDYPTLLRWWSDNKFPPPEQGVLPLNGTGGIMVSVNGKDVCAGFIYDTNSSLAWLEFVVMDFYFKDRQLREQAKTYLIERLCEMLPNKKAIFTSVKNDGLINSLIDSGFVLTSKNTVEMIKPLTIN